MTFERLRFVPFLLWIVFFAFGVIATLSNPHREGSGFKGLHPNVALASTTLSPGTSVSPILKK